MPCLNLRSAARVLALSPLAFALCGVARPALAQALDVEARAGSAYYRYNSGVGVVNSAGNGAGTVEPGAPTAWAAASSSQGPDFYGAQSVRASADYATASVRGTVDLDGAWSDGQAVAQIDDRLVFHAAGAGPDTVTSVGVTLTLTGSLSQMANVGYLYNFFMSGQGSGLSVGWQTSLGELNDPNNYTGWATYGGAGAPSGFDSWQLEAGSATEMRLHGVFSFAGPQKEYLLALGFNERCRVGTDCDMLGQVRFDLPANVTLSSASGLFATAPVPEPQAGALMLAGLLVTGWWMRSRRAPQAD